MKYGFVLFLLTISHVPMSKICVKEAVANSFLPCKDPPVQSLAEQASAPDTDDWELDEGPATNESAIEVNYCQAKVRVVYIKIQKFYQSKFQTGSLLRTYLSKMFRDHFNLTE